MISVETGEEATVLGGVWGSNNFSGSRRRRICRTSTQEHEQEDERQDNSYNRFEQIITGSAEAFHTSPISCERGRGVLAGAGILRQPGAQLRCPGFFVNPRE